LISLDLDINQIPSLYRAPKLKNFEKLFKAPMKNYVIMHFYY